ncbi:unnamed protein product, partial [Staurois parvus]
MTQSRQSRQSDVLHKRRGEFFEVVFFVIIFLKMKNFFFTYCH